MARLPDSFLQALKENVDIVSVIGRSVELKKTGSLNFVGLCPFHGEKTPSFNVSPSKGTYHCFGCGAHGNAVDFLIEHHGMHFRDAVEQLAKEVNMEVPKDKPEDVEAARRHEKITAVLERAQELFKAHLAQDQRMQAYLEKRGITAEMVEKFGIGAAPNKKDFLRSSMPDVPLELLRSAGLVADSLRGDKPVPYEIMRDRVIFPIRGASGKIISFGGRTIDPNIEPKYKNGGETEVFKKSNELYGFYEAAASIRKKGVAVVVEGYVDVVLPYGHGVTNLVAPMGTALSKAGISRLFRNAKTVIFCFDGDDAGVKAAVRSMENCAPLLKAGNTVRFAFLPDKMDPDEFVRAKGAEAFEAFLMKAAPLSKFMISHYASKNDMTTVEGRAQFASEALLLVNQIEDTILKAVLEDEVKLAARIGVADATPIPSVPAPPLNPEASIQAASSDSESGPLDTSDVIPSYFMDDPGPSGFDIAPVDFDDLDHGVVSQPAAAPIGGGVRTQVSALESGSDNATQNIRRPRVGFGQFRTVPGVEVKPIDQDGSVAKPGKQSEVRPHSVSSPQAPASPRQRGAGFASLRQVAVPPSEGVQQSQPGARPQTQQRSEGPKPAAPATPQSGMMNSVPVTSGEPSQFMSSGAVPSSHRRRGFAYLEEQRAAAVAQAGGGVQAGPIAEDHHRQMSAAAKLMTVFVAQPVYAGFVPPEWLAGASVNDDERKALEQMISCVRTYNETHNNDGSRPLSQTEFMSMLKGDLGPHLSSARLAADKYNVSEIEQLFTEAAEVLAKEAETGANARYRP